jgi:hypothetical protein
MSYKALLLNFCCVAAFSAFVVGNAKGASGDPEHFRVELTGAAWIMNTSGTIQSDGTPINFVSDLAAAQQQPTFYGRLVVKPARKHRIVIEGTPFRVSGNNDVQRTIVYRGETFVVNSNVRSSAEVNYMFAGYQYDLVSGNAGHLGFSVGGAYLGATGVLTSQSPAGVLTASRSETIGLPLAGLEGRIFPIPRNRIITLEGSIRGMSVGDYGSYLEATGSGGVSVGPLSILAGYRSVHADLHSGNTSDPHGVDVRFKGPIFSLEWRW